MKVVEGSKVQEGYCALSYSWDQSGEIIKSEANEKSYRIDQGKHEIVYPAKTVRKKPRGRKRIRRKVKFVKFEELIQEICKDFNIKYIWYDQMCINQNDEKAKYSEISQMHQIYSNTYCTIALVPEMTAVSYKLYPGFKLSSGYINLYYAFQKAQWMKRMWTLEEAILSSKVVFIGKNIHCWYHQISGYDFPIFYKDCTDVPCVLHFAHARTSTKEHDHIFALANMFPEIMKEITVNYDQDIQELMVQFYGLLAKQDLSILCFGKHDRYKIMCKTSISYGIEDNSTSETDYFFPLQGFNLPSWTGVYGKHYRAGYYTTSFKNYTVNGRVLRITCAAITNDQRHTKMLNPESVEDMLPPLPKGQKSTPLYLLMRLQPQGSTNKILILIRAMSDYVPLSTNCEEIAQELCKLSHFVSIKKTNFLWANTWSNTWKYFSFTALTEPLDDSSQYVLLAGVPFRDQTTVLTGMEFPVIKKNGDHYKSIGLSLVTSQSGRFFDDITLEEQTFEIQ
ncbi:hypothetical protein INT45_010573 [Circinella minor]|uniref:Heterokaryon incompatibility domain-containing protein n=1 Tax=Circinella minor TaxID=1195481 RepID=A0A8H7VHQ1_9FUNG|nr:hypothetical protein INT45_010573 [Circinella minor]